MMTEIENCDKTLSKLSRIQYGKIQVKSIKEMFRDMGDTMKSELDCVGPNVELYGYLRAACSNSVHGFPLTSAPWLALAPRCVPSERQVMCPEEGHVPVREAGSVQQGILVSRAPEIWLGVDMFSWILGLLALWGVAKTKEGQREALAVMRPRTTTSLDLLEGCLKLCIPGSRHRD